MSDIYLIRHAFTPANNASYNNQEGLWKIAKDKDMPLEKNYGIKQALELGMFLNKLPGRILILTGPYLRVQETLKYALSKMHGVYEIKIIDELTEFNSGLHYAHTVDEVLKMYPNSQKYFEDAKADLDNAVYTNGESRNMLKERVKPIALKIKQIAKENKYDYILLFSHGMINYYLYYWLTSENTHTMKNCEVISVKKKKTIFLPKTFVPKGFMVNINEYVSTKKG